MLTKALRFSEKTAGNAVHAFSAAWKNARAKALYTAGKSLVKQVAVK